MGKCEVDNCEKSTCQYNNQKWIRCRKHLEEFFKRFDL